MAVIKKIKTVFQFRRGTTEEWKINGGITPAAGEPCFDLDLGTLKIGDGVTTYENLKAINGATLSDDGSSLIIEELQDDIEALQALVGTTSVESQIASAMADVATTSDLEAVVSDVAALETKVTTSSDSVADMQGLVEQNNALVADLQTAVEAKADAETVVQLQTIVEQKADTETVTQLQTVVESKVDNTALEALETDMKTYIDEQIQMIEVDSMDGGVIE